MALASLVAYDDCGGSRSSSEEDDDQKEKSVRSEEELLHLNADPSSFHKLITSTQLSLAPSVVTKVCNAATLTYL